MKEHSLVYFTISAQMAVGSFLIIGVVYWRVGRIASAAESVHLTGAFLVLIGLLMALSLLASLFHLGSPQNAWRTLSNLRRSWLSREILFALLFSGLIGILILSQWFRLGNLYALALLAGLTALCGLALVYSMARVYMLRTAPAWNSWLTPAAFFTTTFLLGNLFVGTLLAVQSVFSPLALSLAIESVLGGLGVGLTILLLLEFTLLPLQLSVMAANEIENKFGRPLIQLYLLRLVPVFIGVTLAGILFFSSAPLNLPAALAVMAAFGSVLTSEVFGRILFYESRQPRL